MNIDLALRNFDTLINLPENTRLYASNDNELSYDNRWFTSARRKLDGSSREDNYVPISKTFIALVKDHKKTITELTECIEHLRNRFKILYPDFTKVFLFLDHLEYFIQSFVNGHSTIEQEKNLIDSELLDKMISKIDESEESEESDESGKSTSTATMTIESTKVEIDLTGINDEISELELNVSSEFKVMDCDPVYSSDMDDTEKEDTEPASLSDMDDTEELPPLIEDIEELPPLIEDDEPQVIQVPQIKVVNPLLHRPFDEYVNTLQTQIEEQIIPQLEKETQRILQSINQSVNRSTTKLRRRFVLPERDDSDDSDDSEYQGVCNQNDVCINIPSIPKFFNIIESTGDAGDIEEQLLSDEDCTEECTEEESKSCFDKWRADFENDMNDAIESTAELCKNVGKFITKYL